MQQLIILKVWYTVRPVKFVLTFFTLLTLPGWLEIKFQKSPYWPQIHPIDPALLAWDLFQKSPYWPQIHPIDPALLCESGIIWLRKKDPAMYVSKDPARQDQ